MAQYRALRADTANPDGQRGSLSSGNSLSADEMKDVPGSPKAPSWRRRTLRFSGLILTTVASTVLLIAHVKGYKTHGALRSFIRNHQATTQLVVQVLANILAMIQSCVLCELINILIRIRICSHAFTVSALHFWIAIAQARLDWSVRAKRLGPLACWVILMAAPAALWAGAIAPVSTTAVRDAYTTVASWSNTSLIHEYDSSPSPEVQSKLGFFTYALGDQLSGQLLETARSASTPDGSVRNHSKLDDTHYVYSGRSYGIGGSIGLVNDQTWPSSTSSYMYEDLGYDTVVDCIYNRSTELVLEPLGNVEDIYAYAATGYLPNSDFTMTPEYMTYVGMGSDSRVIAFSVARNPASRQRILAIAAGKTYKSLDTVQCQVDFQPTTFNISVSVPTRSIAVAPASRPGSSADIDASGNLTYILMRQLSQIPKNIQGYDFSLVGESLNTSIANYRSSHPSSRRSISIRGNVSDSSSTLRGLETAFTAMIDDMLVSYSSAQLMIAQDSRQVPAQLHVPAIEFGQAEYIYATFAINVAVLLLVALQAYWTGMWHDLPAFDCLDPSSVVLAASKGGTGVSKAVELLDKNQVSVMLDRRPGDKLVLAITRAL